jgi:hypothetical protein
VRVTGGVTGAPQLQGLNRQASEHPAPQLGAPSEHSGHCDDVALHRVARASTEAQDDARRFSVRLRVYRGLPS